MPNISENRGNTKFSAVLILILLAVVIHIAIKVAPLFIAENSFKDVMSAQAAVSQFAKDEEITGILVSRAREIGIPIKPGDIRLVRNDETRSMEISAKWDVTVQFFFDVFPPHTTHVFHFSPAVREHFAVKL